MKKLRLDWDTLQVESFPTAPVTDDAGTVRAHAVGTLLPPSCPVACHTADDTFCGLTQACE